MVSNYQNNTAAMKFKERQKKLDDETGYVIVSERWSEVPN